MNVEDILADIGDLMSELGSPSPTQEAEPSQAVKPGAPGPGPTASKPAKPDTGKASEPEEVEETYQCLVCGSKIPADAGKCNVCGTIFMSEHIAKDFKGIPVAKISGSTDEIDPDSIDIRQSQSKRSEEIPVEIPLPKSGSIQQLKEADDMPQPVPVAQNNISAKTVVKKTVLKKKAAK